jgi:hypothetical protein
MFASEQYVMTYLDKFLENLGECLYIERTVSIQTAKEKKKNRENPSDTPQKVVVPQFSKQEKMKID